MQKRLFLIALAALSASFLPIFGEEPSSSDFRSQVEKEAFSLINQYRKDHDLPALIWDKSIAKEARLHSRDMATHEVDFGHDGFRQRVDRLRDIMGGFHGAGENVFMASNADQVAQRAVTTWLHSPHHLENIRGDYNYSGMGVWQNDDGAIYFTQIFMKFEPALQEADQGMVPEAVATFGLMANPRTRAGP